MWQISRLVVRILHRHLHRHHAVHSYFINRTRKPVGVLHKPPTPHPLLIQRLSGDYLSRKTRFWYVFESFYPITRPFLNRFWKSSVLTSLERGDRALSKELQIVDSVQNPTPFQSARASPHRRCVNPPLFARVDTTYSSSSPSHSFAPFNRGWNLIRIK